MRPDAEVYSNTMFSLCNRFIRETLSGNAEGYKVFCIQLDKSRVVEVFDPRHAHSIAQVFELCVTIPKKEGGS